MLKFSAANAKIKALADVKGIKPYLTGGKKVYSFDILSGENCPYAKQCKSIAVVQPNGRRKIVDGPHTEFRCFSASQEVLFTNLYNLRKQNGDEILAIAAQPMGDIQAGLAIVNAIPKKAGVIRIHVGGDFKTQAYFDAWIYAANSRPDILFYAYTKSLPFWLKRIDRIPDNFVLTASRGGWKDNLIDQHGLREAVVVPSKYAARKLHYQIDHDDSHAADPSKRGQSFALLVHGPQPAGSKWAKAKTRLKGEGSYKR